YRALEELAEKYNCPFIATAHHLDDQLETVYMRMLRNSPVTSLRGISEKKKTGNLTLVRPLLKYPKKLLESYLKSMGLEWSEDSTNSDNSIERNRIRNIELPKYAKENPDYAEKILKVRENAVSVCSGVDFQETDRVKISSLKTLNKAKRMVVLFGMWEHVMGTLLPQTLINRVNKVLDSYSGQEETVSANGAVFSFSQDTLFLTSIKDDCLFENYCQNLDENTVNLNLPLNLRITTKENKDSKTLRIRFSDLQGKTVVRFPREGDRITMAGGTKRLSRVLQDMKIPPALRKRVPVIADENGLCAVFGRIYGGADRLAARFRLEDRQMEGATCYTCLLE
ncbi:MAG: tRNA lysidine(34) synthetase TilS, partial [Spirochaetales bacterium]